MLRGRKERGTVHKLQEFSQTSGRTGVPTYSQGHKLRRMKQLKGTQGQINGARPGTQLASQPTSQPTSCP